MTETELYDAILRHSLQILRLSAGQEEEVVKVLSEMERELVLLLRDSNLAGASKRDVEKLLTQAQEAIKVGYLRADATTDTHALAVVVAEKTQELMADAYRADITMPSDATMMSLTRDILIEGSPASAWWKKQELDTSFKFAAQVRQGVVNNETQEQIVARITGKQGEPGVMDITRRNARSLVHSSYMTAANIARLTVMKKNAKFTKGFRWLATLDSHTCIRCGALDGQSWDLDGLALKGTTMEVQVPPLHFGCRCQAVPIAKTDALEELFPGISDKLDNIGFRPSSAGQQKSTITFADFLERQPASFIEGTLGKDRAAQFKAGKLTLRDLVSGTSRALTLDELRKH